jgi:hypothetical protein
MIDAFVVLTPFLLLAVVVLLGFVGCDAFYGLQHTDKGHVTHLQTVVNTKDAGTNTITSDPLTLQGGELILVTLQWRSGLAQQPDPVLSGGNFFKVPGGGPFNWNSMKIQSFFAFNATGSTSVVVEAVLMGGSNIQWHLCVSAYDVVQTDNTFYSPQQSDPAFLGTNLQVQGTINTTPGDLVYAVAFAANNDGTFPGNTSIAAGAGFAAESSTGNPLVEDGAPASPVLAQATVSGDPNPRAFMFAVGIVGGTATS